MCPLNRGNFKQALDNQVKLNLSGVLVFQMPNDNSSILMLGNGRATDLPAIAGRAIWKDSAEMTEVQTPFLSVESAQNLLEPSRAKVRTNDKKLFHAEDNSPIHENKSMESVCI